MNFFGQPNSDQHYKLNMDFLDKKEYLTLWPRSNEEDLMKLVFDLFFHL